MTTTAVAVRQGEELQSQPGRFKVVSGSQSAHCCFDFTVVDTGRLHMYGPGRPADYYETVCECFCEAEARAIALALNELSATTNEHFTDFSG